MKKAFLVVSLFSLIGGCASVPSPSPNLALTKQLVHCGLVADNLSKSDAKYKQHTSIFLGAAGALSPNQSMVQLMMEDPGAPLFSNMQQSEMEKIVEDCQSLLYSNMEKVDAAMTQPRNR